MSQSEYRLTYHLQPTSTCKIPAARGILQTGYSFIMGDQSLMFVIRRPLRDIATGLSHFEVGRGDRADHTDAFVVTVFVDRITMKH